jgi:hypothetical protein
MGKQEAGHFHTLPTSSFDIFVIVVAPLSSRIEDELIAIGFAKESKQHENADKTGKNDSPLASSSHFIWRSKLDGR